MKLWLSILVLLSILSCSKNAASSTTAKYCKPKSLFKNWGLSNTCGSSINIAHAWKISKGSKKIVVAVIDTGVDATHPLLKDNMWRDPASTEEDPVYGWNFVTDKPNPIDDHGHGTHVAGIIGAKRDNDIRASGVSPNVSIMAVKYYSDSAPGSVNLANTIKAINYAVVHGANIINYSGGGPEFSEGEYLELKKAEAKGILVVAAAGNEHQNVDLVENYYYPSAYSLSNIITVESMDIGGNTLTSSNYGEHKVDIAAPGENIFSSLPNNRYGYMTGSSQATAFVSGVAALLLSCNPYLTPVQLKEIIMKSAYKMEGLKKKSASQGKVDAYKALQLGCPKVDVSKVK